MLFTEAKISQEQLNDINNFFEAFDKQVETVSPDEEKTSNVSKYITSLATGCYARSVDEIANTKVGNKLRRKRNLQQIMQESFFYGANRFGNNFIA